MLRLPLIKKKKSINILLDLSIEKTGLNNIIFWKLKYSGYIKHHCGFDRSATDARSRRHRLRNMKVHIEH